MNESLAWKEMERLAEGLGPLAHEALDVILDKLSFEEVVALAYDWKHTWARPSQVPPEEFAWRTFGFLCGRGNGKTRSCAEFINAEVRAGRATSIGLCAQNEDKSVEIHIEGPTGLIKTAPPWFRPRFEASVKQLVWPNGARAYVRTPEKPGNIRSGDHEISWLSELQSWPKKTRAEAIFNFEFATRLGLARILWDATPKRGDPVLKELLALSKSDPRKYVVVRGAMSDNAVNLGDGVVDDLNRKYKGTRAGLEELEGEMGDDAENTTAEEAWIENNRRPAPRVFARRGLGIDPAVTTNDGSDETGVIEGGLGVDGQGYVLADATGKYAAHAWADVALDRYVAGRCDVLVVETNKGGNLLVQNLRAAAKDRELVVKVFKKDERPPPHARGVVHVKEVHSRGEKSDRAKPLSTAYQRGRVSHVEGAELAKLEEVLTTWNPATDGRSPDRLDAEVIIMGELLGLTDDEPDLSKGFTGLEELAKALRGGVGGLNANPADLAALLRVPGRGRKI